MNLTHTVIPPPVSGRNVYDFLAARFPDFLDHGSVADLVARMNEEDLCADLARHVVWNVLRDIERRRRDEEALRASDRRRREEEAVRRLRAGEVVDGDDLPF